MYGIVEWPLIIIPIEIEKAQDKYNNCSIMKNNKLK